MPDEHPIVNLDFDPHFCDECDTDTCAENLMNDNCPRIRRDRQADLHTVFDMAGC